MKYFTLFFVLLTFCNVEGFSQSKTLLELKDGDKIERKFYFYPSTLRMLNLQQNAEFNALIKDIRKLIFFRMGHDAFDAAMFTNILSKLREDESFEEYIQVQGGGQQLHVLGKEKPYNTVVLAEQEDVFYIAEIIGKIDVLQIPKLYGKITEGDSTFQNGFINVFDIMGGSNNEEHREDNQNQEVTDSIQNTSPKT